MSDLRSALHDAKTQSNHPLLVPSLLCQLLVDSDANSIRKHAADLYQVEVKTNYHGFYAPEAMVCIGRKLIIFGTDPQAIFACVIDIVLCISILLRTRFLGYEKDRNARKGVRRHNAEP